MDYPMRDRESREPTTVLDHLRPTVVRRRVVVDVAALNQPKLESPETTEAERPPERASGCYPRASATIDDESGPPSSITAPEEYDETGTEEPEGEDVQDEDRAPSVREPIGAHVGSEAEHDASGAEHHPSAGETLVVDRRPSVAVGPTIAVGTMAKRLGLPSAQVAAELVSRGFFEVTPATILTRDTARIVAEAFGHVVEEVSKPEPVKVRRKRTARRAAPTKRASKSATKPKKRGSAGRTKRAA